MHVLLIHQAFVSYYEAGGTRHMEFADCAVQNGCGFTVVASNLNYLSGKELHNRKGLVTREAHGAIKVFRTYVYPALHKSFVWRVISFMSFMFFSIWAALKAGPVDTVMGTSPPIFQAVSAWLVSEIRRKPFLLEIRDLWPDFAIDMGVLKNHVLIGLSKWLEKFLYCRATHILVNSPAYRDYLTTKGISSDKISLIPNGVDPDMFLPSENGHKVRKRYGLNGKFVVVYAGALGMANDISTILRAAKRLEARRDIHILLIGDGKERLKLEKMARELSLSNITFTGALPKSGMSEALCAADAAMATLMNIPMFGMTYPNKVFDYMAAGLPTILGIDGVIRGVVEDAGAGIFVPPGDDAALADAIRMLESQRDHARKMGELARSYVARHFNRRSQAKEFVQLLIRLNQ